MPRRFDPNDENDKVIYDEEEEVTEMYFFTEGVIGIGFSLVTNGLMNMQSCMPRRQNSPYQICDHYVVN